MAHRQAQQPQPTRLTRRQRTHPRRQARQQPRQPPAKRSLPVIQRSTYSIAGQAAALRVVEKDANNTVTSNELVYIHSDHLGSTSAMSDNMGVAVPNSTARYTPFGDWRTEPTADLTDRGYTGHKSNNIGSDGIGLIYMNARYYVPNTNRWLSPDSIIPNPANPQSFNRYSYTRNNPVNLFDPDGHAARYYDEKLDAMVYLSDQNEQRAVEEMWIEFVQEQQAKLNEAGREDVTFAPSTEELSDPQRRILVESQEVAIPTTYREFSQVSAWSEVVVDGLVNDGVPPGDCYCHVLVGTTFGLPGPLIDPKTGTMQRGVFRSDNLIPYTNSVSLYRRLNTGEEIHLHSAVVGFNDSENPGNSILIQVNGSESFSGIYLTRLQQDIDASQWEGIAYLTIPLQVNEN